MADGTKTAGQIAQALGLGETTVRLYCKQYELPLLIVGHTLATRQTDWTEDAIATLTELWMKGMSITKIGLRMGISRNAVVAKARRLNMPGRGSPLKQKPLNARISIDRLPKPKPAPSVRATCPDGPGMPFAERTPSQCSWIIGEPRDFRCCGAPVKAGTSYCPGHHARVYSQEIPKVLRFPGESRRRAA